MTAEEMHVIINLADINADGKLDYNKFCKLYVTTNEQCLKTALEKLEIDSKMRLQQLGSHLEGSSESGTTPLSKPSPRIIKKTDQETMLNREGIHKEKAFLSDGRNSLPLAPRKYRSSTSFNISMPANSFRTSKLLEPNSLKEWQCAQTKGCFFLEENGEIVSHQYKIHLTQRSMVFLTIKPLNLSQEEGLLSHWLTVDTAFYLLRESEGQPNLQLVCFPELRNREIYGWSGELGPGVYCLIPFTTGCRLKKDKKHVTEEAKLVGRGEKGELFLTKKFRAALSDIFEIIDLDGNGLLSLEEYNFFEMRTSGEKCDDEAWAICKENFDTKKNELTRQGFMDLNLMEASDRDGDPSDLWVTLHSMGYNKALEMVEACPFVIDVYADKCRPKIKALQMESNNGQLDKIICKSVMSKGSSKAIDSHENVFLHTYKSDFRVTSVLDNKSENKVIIHVNNELSKNCVNNRSLNIFAVEVAPKSTMVCQHVMPLNERQEWIYNCVYSLMS